MRESKPARVPPAAVARAVEHVYNAVGSFQQRILPPEAVMMTAITNGLVVTRSIAAVAELGVADHLAAGPRHVDDLAHLTGAHPGALYRVLRMLAGEGLFVEVEERRFGLGRLGECLREDAPGSLRGWARYAGTEWAWRLWGSLDATLRNGRSMHENVNDMRFFEWHEQNPTYASVFDAAMNSASSMVNPAIVAAYDLADAASLIDVAGGNGSLLSCFLGANPHLRGTLFDRPHVIDVARAAPYLAPPSLAARTSYAAGDFFESLPPGHDVHVLKWILHDWSDEEAGRILANVRRAAARGSRLLVVEMVVEPGNRPSAAKVLDVVMLALTGGRERTADEFRALLATAGFDLRRVVPTASPFSVIEAVAV
jgi:hypothetical protein